MEPGNAEGKMNPSRPEGSTLTTTSFPTYLARFPSPAANPSGPSLTHLPTSASYQRARLYWRPVSASYSRLVNK